MAKYLKTRTPRYYVIGYNLLLVTDLLVWTDAVCSSAPYKFDLNTNVNVKVKSNVLGADMTAIDLRLRRANVTSAPPRMLHIVRMYKAYGAS